MTETWRPVVDWEDTHEVSSEGRVRSKARTILMRNGVMRPMRGCMLKLQAISSGYLTVTLKAKGRKKWEYVHRLVALAFLGLPPDENMEVCHYDGDKTHNVVSNLRWDSRKGNLSDRSRHGTETRGRRNGMSKLTPDQVRAIRSLKGQFSSSHVAKKYGISAPQVRKIWRRLRWNWLD